MFTECFEILSVHGWGKQLCKVLIIIISFLNSSLLYARPVKKKKKRCSDFRMKPDLNMSYEFKIARSLILSGVVSNQALIRLYHSKQSLSQCLYLYSHFSFTKGLAEEILWFERPVY